MFKDFKLHLKKETEGVYCFTVENPLKRRELDRYISEFTEMLAEFVAFEDDNADFIRDEVEDAKNEWCIRSFSYEPVVDFQVVAIKVVRENDKDINIHFVVYSGSPVEAVEMYILENDDGV